MQRSNSVETIYEDNDEELINKLFELYGAELKRLAFLYVNDVSQCEDIIQEVFISCYKNLASFRRDSQYKTWLTRITINKCKDYQRKWSFRNLIYKPLMEPFMRGNEKSSEQILEKELLSNEVINAISQLSLIYKDILILYYYQDLSIEDISQVTNIKLNTVKSRLTRGRQHLKEILVKEGLEYGSV